jgi:flagellar protein FliS
MDERLRKFYFESQVNNASPGQLLLMFYDSLIEHAERADAEISSPANRNDLSQAAVAVSCCIDLMRELTASLRPEVDPTLCGTLSNLYRFFTKEISAALVQREPRKIRAVLPLIRGLRDAWCQADRRANQLQAVAA